MCDNYFIELTIAYEGDIKLGFESLEQALYWVNTNGITYDWNLDNLTLTGPEGEIDLYSIRSFKDAISR